MAWDALSKEDTNDGVSSYKKEKANRKSTIKDNLQVLKSRNWQVYVEQAAKEEYWVQSMSIMLEKM